MVHEYNNIIILDQKGLATYGHDKARNLMREHENNKRGRNFTRNDPVVISTLLHSHKSYHSAWKTQKTCSKKKR